MSKIISMDITLNKLVIIVDEKLYKKFDDDQGKCIPRSGNGSSFLYDIRDETVEYVSKLLNANLDRFEGRYKKIRIGTPVIPFNRR